ncbi:RNA-binding protein 25 [Octopus bimaculoides]|uniref:PWI domain-containing protein n=1 Tax=Octopus bimaculoides TaxID=37653 RepID=A0A0L8HG79_OCTBM|nr:RNA-binding protein 25 [Octopus bimaculoides]|eukprot:XP_014772566.1 PREDICTED: RNA-binding protein 25-like [Octopus bimaculoides]
MSFPPGPPIGLPHMAPGMMTQSYTFTPMGMVPMGVSMIPPASVMRPIITSTTTAVAALAAAVPSVSSSSTHHLSITSATTPMFNSGQKHLQQNHKKLIPQEIPKTELFTKEEKPPVTTVFVGNISGRSPDTMIREMLQRCGNILSWKRVQGASGKLQGFGFCEYEEPESTLRCIRLLNEWQINDKKLVVKVDAKTKALLDEYKAKKKNELNKWLEQSQKNSSSKERTSKVTTSKDETETKEKKDGEKSNECASGPGDVSNKTEKSPPTTEKPLTELEKPSTESEKLPAEETEEQYQEQVSNEARVNDLDQITMREDCVTRAGLEAIMRDYAEELAKEPPVDQEKEAKQAQKKSKEEKVQADKGLDDMELEEEKKEIINREIKSFRDLHKEDENSDKSRHRERDRRAHEERMRREKMRKGKVYEREHRERSWSRSMSRSCSRSRSRSRSRRDRSRDSSRERSCDRSRERSKDGDKRGRDWDLEDEEEAYERRKLEKKLREKEAAYQERLRNWEARERKKSKEYEKEKDREEARKCEENKEARRLKEFLEDYDDLRDDPKFYRGSALSRRLKEREKEKENDARDRQREKEELEEIRRRLMEEGHADPDGEIAKMERERDEHLKPRLHLLPPLPEPKLRHNSPTTSHKREQKSEDSKSTLPRMQATLKLVTSKVNNSHSNSLSQTERKGKISKTGADGKCDDRDSGSEVEDAESDAGNSCNKNNNSNAGPARNMNTQPVFSPAVKEEVTTKIGFNAMKLRTSDSPNDLSNTKRKKIIIGDVFGQDDYSSEASQRKRKLVPLDYEEEKSEKKVATSIEEKRQQIKQLIEQIPTGKEELFAYSLDWSIVDQVLMDKRIKPWVNKKIVEYIGEEEATLTEFICQKVVGRSTPANILNDVAMVLDEEAEVFVVKMWRLLIYETEAKKAGLVK